MLLDTDRRTGPGEIWIFLFGCCVQWYQPAYSITKSISTSHNKAYGLFENGYMCMWSKRKFTRMLSPHCVISVDFIYIFNFIAHESTEMSVLSVPRYEYLRGKNLSLNKDANGDLDNQFSLHLHRALIWEKFNIILMQCTQRLQNPYNAMSSFLPSHVIADLFIRGDTQCI